jgi:hypothetical protein
MPYLAQAFFSHHWNKSGIPFQVLAVLCAIGGFVAFLGGSLKAADVFATIF